MNGQVYGETGLGIPYCSYSLANYLPTQMEDHRNSLRYGSSQAPYLTGKPLSASHTCSCMSSRRWHTRTGNPSDRSVDRHTGPGHSVNHTYTVYHCKQLK